MSEWTIVISLIMLGMVLLVVEIFFVPGTTLIGILGFLMEAAGVGLSFSYFGSDTGWITLIATGVVSTVTLYFSFRTNFWTRFALKSASDSKVNEGELTSLAPGMEGITLSNLRPVGKAEITGKIVEVRTLGQFLPSGTRIRIIQILSNQIIVEPLA
ncbi:MAG: NfeD family protein [Cyclobacteriaceae bacterium]